MCICLYFDIQPRVTVEYESSVIIKNSNFVEIPQNFILHGWGWMDEHIRSLVRSSLALQIETNSTLESRCMARSRALQDLNTYPQFSSDSRLFSRTLPQAVTAV